jgi:glycosyltransferase involved in cell wall biosynthesis
MASAILSGLRRAGHQLRSAGANLGWDAHPGSLFLVTGGGEWAVKEIAVRLQAQLAAHFHGVTVIGQTTDRPYLSRANIHCLCRPAFFKGGGIPPVHPSNRLVVSWLHGGKHSPEPEIAAACRQLERHWRRVRQFIVPNTMTLRHVLECGVDARIVHVIPNGVDLSLFSPAAGAEARAQVRASLGIPVDAFVVGSFQRDEDDEGRPKLVKGPDILVEALARTHRGAPVHALLTGPTRRYVRQGLEAEGVPHTYAPQTSLAELPRMYHALDAYCVSSREEGGPAPLRESMASGVPVVSARVGLAVDLIEHGTNGFVADVADAAGLASALVQLAGDAGLRQRIAAAALHTVSALDFSVIARRYREEVYSEAFA